MMVTEEENILASFGMNLRATRKARKLSQLDLEVLTGIDESDISKIERGLINISLINMDKIAKALKVDLALLVTIK